MGNTILHVIKKIKNQHQKADIKHMIDDIIWTIDFQHITKDSLSDRVNKLHQSKKITNKINSSKDLIFLNKDTTDMSITDMIPDIQISSSSKILDTSENLLDPFETKPSLSTQVNVIETPKMANNASVNSNEIDQSEFFSDKMFEKAKFNRLKISILKSITIDIKVLIKNKLLRNKYTLADKSSMKYIERK